MTPGPSPPLLPSLPPNARLQIRLLRSMLEWGRELGASIAAENTAGEGSALPDAGDTAAIAAWTETQLALPAVQVRARVLRSPCTCLARQDGLWAKAPPPPVQATALPAHTAPASRVC